MDQGRVRGRPAQFTRDDVVRVGRAMGMRSLSVQAVASALDVTTAAIYRHVASRLELERLIGEAILADLELPADPDVSLEEHLLLFAGRLRSFTIANPGIGAYLQSSFPRGSSGARLLRAELDALGQRGYAPDAGVALASSVSGIAIGLAVGEEARRDALAASGDGDGELGVIYAAIEADDVIAAGHAELPFIDDDIYFRMVMTGAIAGLVDLLPPGTSTASAIAAASPPH